MSRSGPARHANQPAGYPGASSGTLEPVTAPAPAHGQHTHRQTSARDRPSQAGDPRFAETSRRQDPETY